MEQPRFDLAFCIAALITLTVCAWSAHDTQQTQQSTAGATNDAAEVAARRRAYEGRLAAQPKPATEGAAQGSEGTERVLYGQEQAHRLRLGRIARLRALLRERGDVEKLAELDEIATTQSLR